MKNVRKIEPLSLRSPTLECPVDGVKVNENKVRTVAFFVFLLAVTYLLTSFWLVPLFLLIDFAFRAFDYGKYSLLARLSDWIVKALDFPVRLIDQAPKRFAAGVGLVFSAASLVIQVFGINALLLMGILALFAALESFAGFCAGCYVYTFMKPVLNNSALK